MNQTLRVGNNCAVLRSEEIANAHHDRDDHGGTKIQTYYKSLSGREGGQDSLEFNEDSLLVLMA